MESQQCEQDSREVPQNSNKVWIRKERKREAFQFLLHSPTHETLFSQNFFFARQVKEFLSRDNPIKVFKHCGNDCFLSWSPRLTYQHNIFDRNFTLDLTCRAWRLYVIRFLSRYATLRCRRQTKERFLNFPQKFSSLAVIPQTCRYKSKKYECGLSISCVLNGGKPMDLCSGGMIWSCCVDLLADNTQHQEDDSYQPGSIHNASEYCTFYRK